MRYGSEKTGSGRAVYALQDSGVAIVEDLYMAAVQADRIQEPVRYYANNHPVFYQEWMDV